MDGLMSLWAQLAQSGTLRTAAQRRAAGYLAAKEAQEAAELVAAKERGFTSRLDALEQASAVASSNQHGVPRPRRWPTDFDTFRIIEAQAGQATPT
jgi:hypothetical protein